MKILLLGAGASYGARQDSEKKPPLGLGLRDWLMQMCSDHSSSYNMVEYHSLIYAGLAIFDKFHSEENFESLLSVLERKDRITMQKLIQIFFSDLSVRCKQDYGFNEYQDNYDELVDLLSPDDSWSIISLNYDILFEQALHRKGIAYHYFNFPYEFGDKKPQNGIPIFKPHGSINFFSQPDIQISTTAFEPDDYRGTPTEYYDELGEFSPAHPIVFAGMPGAENVLARAFLSGPYSPVMANYARGKKSDSNHKNLKEVRTELTKRCKSANELIAIGVKPISDEFDDPFVADFLKLPFKIVSYVSPSPEDCKRMSELYPNADIYKIGLSTFLKEKR